MSSSNNTSQPHVVIVGAGFAGLFAAKALKNAPVRITLIDRTNHHLFQPLLYQVATAGLSPAHIAGPIRDILRKQSNVEVLMAEATGVDLDLKRVRTPDFELPYDFLILAMGARYNYFGHAEWEAAAPSLKTLNDALGIRHRILLAFEEAELERDLERREALLTFILVGGGPTGVEMAGSIAELARIALKGSFRHVDPSKTRILLLEASAEILSAFPLELSVASKAALEKLGVEVMLNHRVEAVDSDGVIANGIRIPSRTVLWTAGTLAAPAGIWLNVETDRAGRVMVNQDCSAPGHPEIFVLGDSAHYEQNGKLLPGVCQVAMQQGDYVGRLLQARVTQRPFDRPFHYRDKGNMATVGRSFAILDSGRLKMSGFLTWVLWIFIHIWYLIGFRNRISVMFQWAWAYFTFQRTARLITADTRPDLPHSHIAEPFLSDDSVQLNLGSGDSD